MAKKLVVYTDDDCGGCQDFVPEFERRAKEAGVRYKVVNVKQCPIDDPNCQNMEWVPTVMYGEREIDLDKVPELFKRLEKRK